MIELVLRHVPNYGWLPIVREYDAMTGQPKAEIYRGEFRASPITAAYAAQPYIREATK